MKKISLLLLIAILIPNILFATIVHDVTTGSNGTANNTLTFSLTVGNNSNRLLICHVTHTTSTGNLSGVTYAGASMTPSVSVQQGNGVIQTFYKVAPATGANNVVVTMGISGQTVNTACTSLYGVDQSNPIDNTSSAQNNGTSLTSSITTTATNTWIVDAFARGWNAVATPNYSQTERYDVYAGRELAVGTLPVTSAGSVTTGWSSSVSVDEVMTQIAVKDVDQPAVSTPTATPMLMATDF